MYLSAPYPGINFSGSLIWSKSLWIKVLHHSPTARSQLSEAEGTGRPLVMLNPPAAGGTGYEGPVVGSPDASPSPWTQDEVPGQGWGRGGSRSCSEEGGKVRGAGGRHGEVWRVPSASGEVRPEGGKCQGLRNGGDLGIAGPCWSARPYTDLPGQAWRARGNLSLGVCTAPGSPNPARVGEGVCTAPGASQSQPGESV